MKSNRVCTGMSCAPNKRLHMPNVLRTLREVGFTGFLLPDHVPHMVEDTLWGHRARAYSIGYIKALLDAVNALYSNRVLI